MLGTVVDSLLVCSQVSFSPLAGALVWPIQGPLQSPSLLSPELCQDVVASAKVCSIDVDFNVVEQRHGLQQRQPLINGHHSIARPCAAEAVPCSQPSTKHQAVNHQSCLPALS